MARVSNQFRRISIILVISTYILILLGGYVKAIGAGLACPDWPLCYGKLFPFAEGVSDTYPPSEIFAEWFHRLWAGLVSLLMLWVAIQAFNYRRESPAIGNLGILLIVLFTTQILFGALTVIQKLDALIVVAHLGNAVAIVIIEMTIAFFAILHSKPEIVITA